ncbi:LPS export ABC transporter periplasmic protein LptC [Zobellella aerophila]|uniref:LPS export ABC transporter periplasmic protein LptC n=1 Tax=Zobellella aerophila TaxID=870480 RepID=A0ABP6VV15_9GAMM
MNRQTWLFAVLLLFALVCWQWLRPAPPNSGQDQNYQPDFIAKDLSSLQYNNLGLPYRGMNAEHAEYYGGLAMTLLEKPVILLYSPDGRPQWQLSGDEGIINTDDNAILRKSVLGQSLQSEALIDTISTEYLEMDFVHNQLRSNQAVMLRGPGYHTQGQGLLGRLEQQTVELLNGTQATYNP